MKKKPFTIDEHRVLGSILHAFLNSISPMVCTTMNRYPKHSEAIKGLGPLLEAIHTARHKLDEQAAADLGDSFTSNLYYPVRPLSAKGHRISQAYSVADLIWCKCCAMYEFPEHYSHMSMGNMEEPTDPKEQRRLKDQTIMRFTNYLIESLRIESIDETE